MVFSHTPGHAHLVCLNDILDHRNSVAALVSTRKLVAINFFLTYVSYKFHINLKLTLDVVPYPPSSRYQ